MSIKAHSTQFEAWPHARIASQFMHAADVENALKNLDVASSWLQSLGVTDSQRGWRNLQCMHGSGLSIDLLAMLATQLESHLHLTSDPDMALNNLERYVAACESPVALASLLERDSSALPVLLQIFSTSQYLSDQLVSAPEVYDLLRITEGQPVTRELLVDEITEDVTTHTSRRDILTALRQCKHRETLRIAFGDIILQQKISTVTDQISHLADALCEAALQVAWRSEVEKRGQPRLVNGQAARFVVLGLGKHGGAELNYSSDIDLILLYEGEGRTDGPRPINNAEFFDRLSREFVQLLTEPTQHGVAYRVDLRLRPQGKIGPICAAVEPALHYYDTVGQTWERQAFVKARPVAGDIDLGEKFLADLEPWLYRRYLGRTDISGIKALKRRIEHRARKEQGGPLNVKTGDGGIRDIEFVIQFLQLLNGADLPAVRCTNTLEAIDRLAEAGCLTTDERALLSENYAFLRKVEHRLQILLDLQTHTIPSDSAEQRKLALRLGYRDTPEQTALAAFEEDRQQATQTNRRILDHLLHDAFGEQQDVEPEVDLILDPDPTPDQIDEVLGKYHFRQPQLAYGHLMTLATEKIRFLSTRRCRHFLAAIAPALLREISRTPDPDATLVELTSVSDSLGGKGVLWELFSFNPHTMKLYVTLCASSPYLTSILTSNPGMIDELMDSLVLDKLPTLQSLEATLDDLCRGAEDVDPILHSFKNVQHLRVGVRDILGKESVRATHRALSNVAEVILRRVTRDEFEKLVHKFGRPRKPDGSACELVIVALGKLGGQEPNYHSDLDLAFFFEADGETAMESGRRGNSTTNQHFFAQLVQRIIKVVTNIGPFGRLYELDPRLRPSGRSGLLTVSLAELRRYFESGSGMLWERQAFSKARVVYGSEQAAAATLDVIRHAVFEPDWQADFAEQIRSTRLKMEAGASPHNLKRASGGTVDIEFIAQMLTLQHGGSQPQIIQPGTLQTLEELHAANLLGDEDFRTLSENYLYLRGVEARLRLMNTTARHDLPTDDAGLSKLAYLLNYGSPEALLADTESHLRSSRELFDRIFNAASRN